MKPGSWQYIGWVFATVGCSTAVAPRPREMPQLPDIAPTSQREPVWQVQEGLSVRGAIEDVGALGRDEAVVIAGGAVYRSEPNGTLVALCAGAHVEAGASVQAEGDGFVVLSGDEAHAEVLRSGDRGATCQRVRLPSLFVRNTARGRLRLAMHGEQVFVWSSSGAILQSLDGGTLWQRLPTMAGVVDMCPYGDGGSLAVVSRTAVTARADAAMYAMARGEQSWHLVRGAGALMLPVALQSHDREVVIATASGTVTLEALGTFPRRRIDPATRYNAHRPRILATAGTNRFLGVTDNTLLTVDATHTEAFAALPGGTTVHSMDAASDGALWVTDGSSLWHGRLDSSLAVVLENPLRGDSPEAFAAHEGTVMVAGSTSVAWRHASETTWRRAELPRNLHPVRAAHIDANGALFVLGANTLAVADAGEFSALRAPTVSPFSGGEMDISTHNDRWWISGGAVNVSDDHSRHWDVCLGNASVPTPGDVLSGGIDPTTEVSATLVAVAHGAETSMLCLDGASRLWRSADGVHFATTGVMNMPPIDRRMRVQDRTYLAWDGGLRVAVLFRDQVTFSRDGGITSTTEALPFVPRWARYVGDTLVAAGSMSSLLPERCRNRAENALFVYANGWIPDAEACAHMGTLFAPDGDAVWVLGDGMSLHRASLPALVRTLTGH
jgi:hypothetical protein